MTIMTNIALQKADAVELERRYSGKLVRRIAYTLYFFCMMISTFFLYLYPTLIVISLYVFVHLSLLCSLYFFLHLVVDSNEVDLVYDGTRLAWRPSFSGEIDVETARRSTFYPNHHLSYTFI